jgi:hypothetical protein
MHPLISPPSPIHHPSISIPPSQGQLIKQRTSMDHVRAHLHTSHADSTAHARTLMIPCPYAFVGTEMTTRRPPLAHAPLFQCEPPLWYTSDRPSRWWGQHTHMSCHRALSNLNLQLSLAPVSIKLNYFSAVPNSPRHTTHACRRLAWNLYRFRLPAYRHSWNNWRDCSRSPKCLEIA